MYFQRFYDTRLAQASYLIGCQITGDAVVVDPNRDVQQYIAERLAELSTDLPLIVHCQGGARSAIAARVLQARGIRNVVNLVGGYAAWERAGLPTTRDAVESVS